MPLFLSLLVLFEWHHEDGFSIHLPVYVWTVWPWAVGWGWERSPESILGRHLTSVVLIWFSPKGWGWQDFLLAGHHAWTPLPQCDHGPGNMWSFWEIIPGIRSGATAQGHLTTPSLASQSLPILGGQDCQGKVVLRVCETVFQAWVLWAVQVGEAAEIMQLSRPSVLLGTTNTPGEGMRGLGNVPHCWCFCHCSKCNFNTKRLPVFFSVLFLYSLSSEMVYSCLPTSSSKICLLHCVTPK